MGGGNELVECLGGGAVVESGSGAVARLVGDGVEVGLVAGDGGSFGQVAADEPVGVFVGSSLPGAVGVSEEHVHAGVVGEALVAGAGHFSALVPGQPAFFMIGILQLKAPCGFRLCAAKTRIYLDTISASLQCARQC